MKKKENRPFTFQTINRILTLTVVLILVLPWMGSSATASAVDAPPLAVGVRSNGEMSVRDEFDRLDQFDITAPQLRYPTRTIQVYLPPDYYTSDNKYPVIYLHDGGLLFNPPSRDCLYDETLDLLVGEGAIGGVIAVGIFSSPNRWDEYSPWVNNNMHDWIVPAKAGPSEGGEGDAYLDFIIDTLKPEIDARYRTRTGRRSTAIGGFSMGGLISLYAGLERPDVFSKVLAVSPAIWFAEGGGYWLENNQFIEYVNNLDVPDNVAFYIDIGTNEWDGQPINAVDKDGNWLGYPYVWLDGAHAAYDALKTAGVSDQNLALVEDPGGVHEPYSWAGRFAGSIRWLYGERAAEATPTATATEQAVIDATSTLTETPVVIPTETPQATIEPTMITEVDPVASEVPGPSTKEFLLSASTIRFFLIALVILSLLVVAWLVKLIVQNR